MPSGLFMSIMVWRNMRSRMQTASRYDQLIFCSLIVLAWNHFRESFSSAVNFLHTNSRKPTQKCFNAIPKLGMR